LRPALIDETEGLQTKVTTVSEYVSPDDAAAALEALGTADRIRLELIARNRLHSSSDAWTDLLQEAVKRILEGTRKWPRGVPLVAFVAEVMRSLASEYKRQQRQIQPENPTNSPISDNPGPDREAEARAEIRAIEDHFGDDDQALAVVMAKFEGYSPEEIQDMFSLTSTQYDSTLKRIRRKVDDYKRKGAEQ
jgi:RNA polymerase sigma factor (sigma-70 family)